ncbi:MAG: RNA methyltransferase [Pseudomonadota bacterium]
MNIVQLSSKENAHYKHLKKIAASAQARREHAQTLLDGIHLLTALADSHGALTDVIVRHGAEHHPEIAQCLTRFPGTRIILLDEKLYDAISPVTTPVGIMGLFSIPKPPLRLHACAVLLENIQDPGNLGGLLRTAAAAGVGAVFLSAGCTEAWSPKALRAGMGAHFSLDIHEQQHLPQIAAQYTTSIATQLHAPLSIYDLAFGDSVAFIFGNEGAGLRTELALCATHQVHIPMPGRMESLNVTAAAAICLFERVRQLSVHQG